MGQARLFTIDTSLIMCLAAAWLIELALGSPRYLPAPSKAVARFLGMSADRVLALVERLGKLPGGEGGKQTREEKYTQGVEKLRKKAGNNSYGVDRPSSSAEKRAGVFFVFYVISFSFILTAVLLDFARRAHPLLYYLLNIIILCWVFNVRATVDYAFSSLKSAPEPYRGAIVNLSKNCLDGICAPMIYASVGVLLGIPAVFAAVYKILSILDGVIGHTKGEFKSFGWAAAKLDDAMNFFPARICGIVLPLLAPVCGLGFGGMRRGFRATREGHSTQVFSNNYISPNNAWPAAAFAGVLGIRLGGGAPDVNDQGMVAREPDKKDIVRATRLMFAASFAILSICCGTLLYYAF